MDHARSLGPPLNNWVMSMAYYDDGTGPALYVGGLFTFPSYVAKWNGSSFVPVGGGTDGPVSALIVHDDGNGPALYAGGSFGSAGGVAANGLARWNGQSWSAVGGSFSNGVNIVSLEVHDVGSGPKLYAGGWFNTAPGGVPASNVAVWDGTAWAALGAGTSSTLNPAVLATAALNGSLYVGGNLVAAGGEAVNHVARWNGSAWTAMPAGNGFLGTSVDSSLVFDDGSGPALYLGGYFFSAGATPAKSVVKFDGTHWSAFGAGIHEGVKTIAIFDGGSGPRLFAGGSFAPSGGPSFIAMWNGTSWVSVGTGGPTSTVSSLLPLNLPGYGPLLAVGGSFTNLGGTVPVSRVAFWNGSVWTPSPGTPPSGPLLSDVRALAYGVTPGGPTLFAGGNGITSTWKLDASGWGPVFTTGQVPLVNDYETL